jgi:cell division septum initiation protein DivIVA
MPMTELAVARTQLEQAIARLEQALQARGDTASVERALVEAQAESRRLREAADSVNHRLDAAIGRLQSMLVPGADR